MLSCAITDAVFLNSDFRFQLALLFLGKMLCWRENSHTTGPHSAGKGSEVQRRSAACLGDDTEESGGEGRTAFLCREVEARERRISMGRCWPCSGAMVKSRRRELRHCCSQEGAPLTRCSNFHLRQRSRPHARSVSMAQQPHASSFGTKYR